MSKSSTILDEKKFVWTPETAMDGTQWLIMFGIALTGLLFSHDL